jgi:alpha/beta superfamily hydrolase
MRITAVAFACVGLIATLTFAAAAPEQRVVSFSVDGLKIVGTLELPEATKNAPVVLLLHGFTGKRDELAIPSANNQGIFARAAEAWAKAGFASLRIDFRGSGDSEGSYADTTISDEIKEALAATDFLASEKDVDASRLYVVGWSQGGTVATAVAGRSAHPIKAVALWAPASNPAATFAAFLGADYIKAGLASGGKAVTKKLPWGADVSLKTPFFEDLYNIDPPAELAHYSGPVFVAVGTNDPIVNPQPAMGQLLLTYHKGPGELWVRPMDHSFNSFQNVETVDALIAATQAFMEKNK